MTNSNDYKDC